MHHDHLSGTNERCSKGLGLKKEEQFRGRLSVRQAEYLAQITLWVGNATDVGSFRSHSTKLIFPLKPLFKPSRKGLMSHPKWLTGKCTK